MSAPAQAELRISSLQADEICQTEADNKAELVSSFDLSFTTGVKTCVFPFRYKEILYYACTNLTVDGSGPWSVCATETDSDFNAKTLGECDIEDRCPIQGEYQSNLVIL